jgi:hypothetical protein
MDRDPRSVLDHAKLAIHKTLTEVINFCLLSLFFVTMATFCSKSLNVPRTVLPTPVRQPHLNSCALRQYGHKIPEQQPTNPTKRKLFEYIRSPERLSC